MENPANLHQNLFQMVLSGRKLMEFHRGGTLKKSFEPPNLSSTSSEEKKLSESPHLFGWASGNQWLDFERRHPTSRLKTPTEKMVMFFSRWDPFFSKSTPLQNEEHKKKHWNMVAKTIQKTLLGDKRLIFKGDLAVLGRLPQKWLGCWNLKKISYYIVESLPWIQNHKIKMNQIRPSCWSTTSSRTSAYLQPEKGTNGEGSWSLSHNGLRAAWCRKKRWSSWSQVFKFIYQSWQEIVTKLRWEMMEMWLESNQSFTWKKKVSPPKT